MWEEESGRKEKREQGRESVRCIQHKQQANFVPLGDESWLRDFALSASSSSLLGLISAISTAMCLHSTSISNLRFS